MSKTFVFVTYETAHAPCGGIAAVMQHLPRHFKNTAKVPACVITPFHYRIAKTSGLKLKPIGTVVVPCDGQSVRVNVLKRAGAVAMYFLQAEDSCFFAGVKHPYDVDTSGLGDAKDLLRDSLFFGVAVRESLKIIAPGAHCVLMLQDWEAATTALALAGVKSRHKCFITLHNSYDSGASGAMLRRFGIAPSSCLGATVLTRALKVSERSVFTVSDQFALDFLTDPLQKIVMAPHLQKLLAPRLTGVCNGPFVKLGVDGKLITAAIRGDYRPLQRWKTAQKKTALKALGKVRPSAETPVWGDPKKFRRDDAPWFVFAGRDDSRQKGYDVAVAAIRLLLKKHRTCKFLFFPIPGDEELAGLAFLKKLAVAYPENVIAFPFIWREGFSAALCGAAYGVMPSLYEPFGMASEFYLQGTAGIARATGGLIQQINPVRGIPSYSRAVVHLADRWHQPQTPATGFLYREFPNAAESIPAIANDWRQINAAGYFNRSGQDRVNERGRLPLFKSMAGELGKCLTDALKVYVTDPAAYHTMLAAGVRLIQRRFSWTKAAREYLGGM